MHGHGMRGSGAGAAVGAEGAWACERVFCGLNLKCMMVGDRGRHPQPGASPWTLLCPASAGELPWIPPSPVPTAPLRACVTQPGAVPWCARPRLCGISPLSGAHERGVFAATSQLLGEGRVGSASSPAGGFV